MQDTLHDPGMLAALAEGRLEGAERERVVAHVADCPECRRTLAALGNAMADGTLSRSPERAPGTQRWTRPQVWLPIAASVLIASFALFQYSSVRQPTLDGEELLVKRGAARTVAGKTFRMTGGEWLDTSFDLSIALPTVIARGREERSAVLQRVPDLAPYDELGDRVTVVWNGTVYRFEP
jgi:anti-sigma factor ChrR (cupin superfamily)